MGSFDKAWLAVARPRGGEAVSPELRPLLRAVYEQCLSVPFDRRTFKASLENLLSFLVHEGRTNANCWAVDLFFAISLDWERDWAEQDIPEDLTDILR